ncbi:type II toxin-antitoxin system RelB family antitoxin [Mobiluncus mulieris]|uniref:CopG family transcriptional regulator n=2 Tax=Mobiluncus mulieris TaxID=2052 RepID=A0ABD4U0L3_9ACTO|nr:hypothetical protein [Mobiluncus mulieris]MCU9970007.1 hypothetical protein [Mobiluncus mulieris]MCV0010490.1 hypothetical protein [Mobiluncus mulieris]
MGEVLSVELSAEDKARLEWVSEQTRQPTRECVQNALDAYLDDMEDYYLAIAALREAEQSGEFYTPEQVRQMLDLED